MAKRRLFLAIVLPAGIISALERIQDALREAFPEARLANADGMHLTVKFIGYVEDTQIPAIADAAREAAAKTIPFDVSISGLGAFPSINRPRVIWAGARDDGQSAALYAELNAGLAKLDIESETRPYSPHITLARINKPRATPIETTVRAAALSADIGIARADRLVLFESVLKNSGAEYEALDEFMFDIDTNTCL